MSSPERPLHEYVVTCPRCARHTIVEWSDMPPGGVPPTICGNADCEYTILSETEGEPIRLDKWNAAGVASVPSAGAWGELVRQFYAWTGNQGCGYCSWDGRTIETDGPDDCPECGPIRKALAALSAVPTSTPQPAPPATDAEVEAETYRLWKEMRHDIIGGWGESHRLSVWQASQETREEYTKIARAILTRYGRPPTTAGGGA